MKWLSLLLLLVASPLSAGLHAPFTKVAIIDTGLDLSDVRFKDVLCRDGHWNFVENSPNTFDTHGHGTHVAGLIKRYAEDANYCLVILRYYSKHLPNSVILANSIAAIRHAKDIGVNFINYSAGGNYFSEEEYLAIRDLEDITFVAAAGNDNKNIDYLENYYYPASYRLKNVVVVGNIDKQGNKVSSSNYGRKVTAWENGENSYSELPNGKYGYMTGTSQATAIFTGKLVRKRNK